MHVDSAAILQMDASYRKHLINSFLGFKPGLLIGTKNEQDQTNLAIFSQVIHLGANPPLLGIIFRPDSAERHTLQNIRKNKYFSINHVHEKMIEAAHQTSARYDSAISEFDAVSLTIQYIDNFEAPFVEESKIKCQCSFVEEKRIEVNQTILLIASIDAIFIPDEFIKADGFVDSAAAKSIAVAGLDAYYACETLNRFSYAKPNKPISSIL